jgi:hypothetical protein
VEELPPFVIAEEEPRAAYRPSKPPKSRLLPTRQTTQHDRLAGARLDAAPASAQPRPLAKPPQQLRKLDRTCSRGIPMICSVVNRLRFTLLQSDRRTEILNTLGFGGQVNLTAGLSR